MTKHATALRAFNHADDRFAGKQVILDMDPGQFNDWQTAGLVREATDDEVAAARGDKPAAKKRSAPRKPRGTAKAADGGAHTASGDTKPDA